jgi:hypothetical protein
MPKSCARFQQKQKAFGIFCAPKEFLIGTKRLSSGGKTDLELFGRTGIINGIRADNLDFR